MLLEARKRPALERLYAAYGRRILRRAFARVWVGGAAWPDGAGPSIAFLNHSAWWDPVLTLFLSHDLFRRDGYGIMQGAQLERYPFFRTIGCFGVTENTLADARLVSEYAARVLGAGDARTLWVFPQGELLPPRVPVRFRSGTARLARAAPGMPLVPVAVRYEFRGEQRPECVVRVGPALVAGPRERSADVTRRLEGALERELAELDAALVRDDLDDYRPVLDGRGSVSSFYERTVGRLTSRGSRDEAGRPVPDTRARDLRLAARPPAGPPAVTMRGASARGAPPEPQDAADALTPRRQSAADRIE